MQTSFQAVLDNYWGDLDFTTDPTLTGLWDFVSEGIKVLDSAIHSFCQEQTKHDWRVDKIIRDLCADPIDPESFVSTQDFDTWVQTITVDLSHATLHKELDAMKCSLLNYYVLMVLRTLLKLWTISNGSWVLLGIL